MKKVVVIGGGAAGIIAAGFAAKNGNMVTLIEKNDRLGKKLAITGKGRCNITNACDRDEFMKNIPENGRFLFSAFSAFSSDDVVRFFEDLGVPTKVERGNRVFPVSDKASDVVNALSEFLKKEHVRIVKEAVTEIVVDEDYVKAVKTTKNTYDADSVILATGGLSYPTTGSTGDGFRFAKKMGHTIVSPSPSLVPLISSETWIAEIMGLSLRNCSISVVDGSGKKIYNDFGELLFTHFGLSGPVILSASSHMNDNTEYTVNIDLKPALDFQKLDARVLRDFEKMSRKFFANSLDELLPKKIIPIIIKLSGINPECPVNQITKEQRQNFVELLKKFPIKISGFRPISEAIITAGGVSCKEINPSTMESKKVSGLFFAGEVIDVFGYTGGFNLQIAFSTGYLAGINS